MYSNNSQRNYKVLFGILLVISIRWPSLELLLGVLLMLGLFFLNRREQKISSDFITAALPLIIIFIIGITLTLFYPYNYWDIGKDIAYFLKPILLLFIGYALIHTIRDKIFFFKAFVYLSIVYALLHIFNLITYPDVLNTSINTLRNNTGLSNHIELIAIVFLFLSLKYPAIQIFKEKKMVYSTLILLLISFILYFSRTMWVAIFLLLITSFGYAKISSKALKYIGLLILLISSFYIYLYSIEIDRDEPGISAFLYKMKIAPEEIFLPKVDLNDHAALWDHWRAYEAKMAFDQMNGFDHVFGRGFGSLVNLHFVAPLNKEGMQYISHLHNGYAMIYYKTGAIGLLFYFVFILNLYLFTFYHKNKSEEIPITNLISAVGIYLLFSSLIITGAYNLKDIYLFALGGLLALNDSLRKNKMVYDD